MRPESDIRDIRIFTQLPGVDGWVADVRYGDGKIATIQVDRGTTSSMLFETFKSIQRQLDSVPPPSDYPPTVEGGPY